MKKKLSREEFLRTSTLAVAATISSPLLQRRVSKITDSKDKFMLDRLVKANDTTVERLLQEMLTPQRRQYYRNLSGAFANLTAAFSHPDSRFYESDEVLKALHHTLDKLRELQYTNGTLDSGGNRMSPPDTAFLLESLYQAVVILRDHAARDTGTLKTKLDEFMLAAGEGIRTGGVHTPNHRWEVCSVLAKLHKLYGDQRYVDRIDEWLAEGIYQNADGNYPERSRNYAVVENQAFITMGELLNRPEFFDIVSRNLTSTYYYMELDGELVSLDSRRQDQFRPISSWRTYFTYRYMAIRQRSDFFAAIARDIESHPDFDRNIISRSLPQFMSSAVLQQKMPEGESLPTTYTKYFKESDLVRIKRGDMTASIFGGNDLPLIVASGRSCNPTFFTFRKGEAVLEYARLATSFFNTGYVRSDGLKQDVDKYMLYEKKEAYYYDPLPKHQLNEFGDYKLSESVDGRFWSKMDFESRPRTTLSLESSIVIQEVENSFMIEIMVEGTANVEVTLDLCFSDGGILEGVSPGEEDKDFFLNNGIAKYAFGSDTIEVGPGRNEHGNVRRLDGEVYSTHFGSIKGDGQHVYITGIVPFKHELTIR